MSRTLAVICLCVAMVLSGSQVRAKAPQSRCARIGQKWVDFWNGFNVATAFDVFTEDIVYNDITADPTKPVAEGRDQFLAFAQQGFFVACPISSFELGQSACQGQQGFFEWTWTAVDSPGCFFGTGKPFTVRGVAVIEIQGNRISRNSDFWDFATVLTQLGKL